MPKSAKDRMAKKVEPKRVVLEKDFAGVRKGQILFVGTPQIIAYYIAKIPYGQTRTIPQMRGELARRRKCDATCPVSTSIFIRTAAQAAIEDMEAGAPTSEVTPFWRLLTANDKIAKRLPIDPEWIDLQRASEVDKA
ncbi:MAG: hypothetical protein AAF557_12650 [Pseudomonadota bacterium]